MARPLAVAYLREASVDGSQLAGTTSAQQNASGASRSDHEDGNEDTCVIIECRSILCERMSR